MLYRYHVFLYYIRTHDIYKAYPPPLYQIIKGSALTVFTVDLVEEHMISIKPILLSIRSCVLILDLQ
jgi:hypothetical protein